MTTDDINLEQLRDAADRMLGDMTMMTRLIRKYPIAARLRLPSIGISALAQALSKKDGMWPVIIAYGQGGGKIDGCGPTIDSRHSWVDVCMEGNPSREELISRLDFLVGNEVKAPDEYLPGKKILDLLAIDLEAHSFDQDDQMPAQTAADLLQLTHLGVKMGFKCGEEERNPIRILACDRSLSKKHSAVVIADMIRHLVDLGAALQVPGSIYDPVCGAIGQKDAVLIKAFVLAGIRLEDYDEQLALVGLPVAVKAELEALSAGTSLSKRIDSPQEASIDDDTPIEVPVIRRRHLV